MGLICIEAVLMGLLCLFGFAGNSVSTVCLLRDRSTSATPFLLVSLGIADTLFLAGERGRGHVTRLRISRPSSRNIYETAEASWKFQIYGPVTFRATDCLRCRQHGRESVQVVFVDFTLFLATVFALRVLPSIDTFVLPMPWLQLAVPYLGKYVYPTAIVAETGIPSNNNNNNKQWN